MNYNINKGNEELIAIAKMKNITLPNGLDEAHQKKLTELGVSSFCECKFSKFYFGHAANSSFSCK